MRFYEIIKENEDKKIKYKDKKGNVGYFKVFYVDDYEAIENQFSNGEGYYWSGSHYTHGPFPSFEKARNNAKELYTTGKEFFETASNPNNKEVLDEYGSHGHPGYGNGLFARSAYQFFASEISFLNDQQIKEHIANWFSYIFKKDNPNFKPDAFIKAATSDFYRTRSYPKLQQRHFYYLAGEISQIKDVHERTFLTDFVGKIASKTNSNFQIDRWNKFCNPDATLSKKKEPKELTSPNMIDDEDKDIKGN